MDAGQFVVGQFLEAHSPRLRRLDGSARRLVRDAERNTLAYQPFGDVGGQRVAQRCELGHPVGVEGQGSDQSGHRGQQHFELADGVEHRLLVLLQVPVVRQRLRLQRGQQSGEVADQPTRLSARQFGDVGVLLLRHDRAAGRPGVVQPDVAELRGAPEDDVLGEPGQVDGDHRQDERALRREVAGRGGIDGVVGRGGEAELLGDGVGIQSERRTRQRSGSVRRHRGSRVEVDDPRHVAQQRVGVGEQMMGQQDRLRRLQMGLARHDRRGMRCGLHGKRRNHVEHAVADGPHRVAQPHPKQRGHLVVS